MDCCSRSNTIQHQSSISIAGMKICTININPCHILLITTNEKRTKYIRSDSVRQRAKLLVPQIVLKPSLKLLLIGHWHLIPTLETGQHAQVGAKLVYVHTLHGCLVQEQCFVD